MIRTASAVADLRFSVAFDASYLLQLAEASAPTRVQSDLPCRLGTFGANAAANRPLYTLHSKGSQRLKISQSVCGLENTISDRDAKLNWAPKRLESFIIWWMMLGLQMLVVYFCFAVWETYLLISGTVYLTALHKLFFKQFLWKIKLVMLLF